MRCPSCDATIKDERALFCPRCGHALGATDAEATVELGDGAAPDLPSQTSRLPAPLGERKAMLQGWTRAGTVAVLGFLTAVAVGAMLVLGAKLQYPSVGSEAGAFAGLEVIVMAGLAVLGAPVAIGDLSLSALPLGALAVVGWAIVWGTQKELRDEGTGDARSAVLAGAKAGVPLALMCLLAAVVFRIEAKPSPISVDPFAAGLVGALWGVAFGALGGSLVAMDLRSRARRMSARLAERSRLVYEGVVAVGLMLTTTALLGAVFSLLWVVVVLARGPSEFGWGEALASLIYMCAFAPNVVISVVSVALGAPVEVGAQVTVGGRVVGPLKDVSLFTGDLPWPALALLVIPLIACFVGGYSARRTTRIPRQGAAVLGAAALAYAFVLADLAVLAEARLGAGLVRSRGFALIAPNAVIVFLLALAWAAALGYAGWWYANHQFPSRNTGEIAGTSAPEKARTRT